MTDLPRALAREIGRPPLPKRERNHLIAGLIVGGGLLLIDAALLVAALSFYA